MASDFVLADCLTTTTGQLCWDCANAYGGCPWTAIDPKTHRPMFRPVPGWDATPTVHITKHSKYGNTESYRIRGCPLFVREVRHDTHCD